MRNLVIILLAFLLLSPSMQAHTDVVVYKNIANHLGYDATNPDELCHSTQHQNDSEDDKNTEHHHHCIIISFSSTFILSDFNFNFTEITHIRRVILFYQNLHTSACSGELLQPPQV